MIKKANELVTDYREHMRDGAGTVEVTGLATIEEMNNKGRLFGKIVLNPGCSIGYHVHKNDSELFYIIKGTAKYSDNGDIKTISAGDVTVCAKGTGHSLANESDEVVELIAIILYAD